MPPSTYRAFLTAPLTQGGSETEIYVNSLQTLTGETITWDEFTPFTRGILVVDPEAQLSSNPEICSFTGIDATNIGFTGVTRGLSAVSSSVVAANKVFHGANCPVIISWGAQNISDLIAYVNTLVSGAAGSASNTTSGITKLTENLSALPRAMAALVSQQASPNMTLAVQPFSIASGGNTIQFAGGNTGTITAPVSNPRIDLIVYSTSGSALAVRGGSEGVSPTAPTPSTGDIVLASVYNTTAETSIKENNDSTNGYIQRWYQPGVFTSNYLPNNFITSTGSANAYVVTFSPVPAAYTTGMKVSMKANFANTGSATVNVNSLGAKTIKRPSGTNLIANDILNGQIVDLEYDGTNFQMLTVPGNLGRNQGVGTFDLSTATNATVTYSHALGITPRLIKITAVYASDSSTTVTIVRSEGYYDGTNTNTIYFTGQNAAGAATNGTDTSNILVMNLNPAGSSENTAVATFDATHIILTAGKTGTPTGTASVLWQAWA